MTGLHDLVLTAGRSLASGWGLLLMAAMELLVFVLALEPHVTVFSNERLVASPHLEALDLHAYLKGRIPEDTAFSISLRVQIP